MRVTLPSHIPGILNDIPEQDQPKEEEESKFWRSVAYELSQLMKYAEKAEQTQIVFNDYRKAGSQYIWEFYVNDLSITKRGAYNWHGQNVSQWLYAGCILVQDGQVSMHH